VFIERHLRRVIKSYVGLLVILLRYSITRIRFQAVILVSDYVKPIS
jgi:hypothetical protein